MHNYVTNKTFLSFITLLESPGWVLPISLTFSCLPLGMVIALATSFESLEGVCYCNC